jgi:hypothetical protein
MVEWDLAPRRVAALRSDRDPARRTGAAVRRTRVRGFEGLPGRRRGRTQLVSPARELAAHGALGAAALDARGLGRSVFRGHRCRGRRLPPHHSARIGPFVIPAPVPVRHRGRVPAVQFHDLSLHGDRQPRRDLFVGTHARGHRARRCAGRRRWRRLRQGCSELCAVAARVERGDGARPHRGTVAGCAGASLHSGTLRDESVRRDRRRIAYPGTRRRNPPRHHTGFAHHSRAASGVHRA